jgi:tetratricopeptide (TPR) repeat protein
MGAVYEAVGTNGERVALKTLLKVDPTALYRLKQEFRTLADVHHRNLVRLHELVITEAAPAFFTMELVDGVDFLEHVWGAARRHGDHSSSADETTSRERSRRRPTPDATASAAPAEETTPQRANLEKLRPALRQLVEGLHALHLAGKVHRDIKPSNVLVTLAGRTVLLDFGVATDLPRGATAPEAMLEADVVGTPKYMAPEQVLGEAATPASDFYGVGVMLYEALVGRPPFGGTSADVMTRKTLLTPIAPAACVEGVPPDLDELCAALLQVDPSKRPSARDVLWILGSIRGSPSQRAPAPRAPLVGRNAEYRALREAFDTARAGRAVTVLLSGAGGIGKSTLVQTFLDEIASEGRANVLCGRAYERESVPYKAVDGVIDALSQLLVELEAFEGDLVLPRHMRSLARLFPVLRRVAAIGEEPESSNHEPQTDRRRAFRALRECLMSVASRRPLVIFVDDVQWGDADSALLLTEVVRRPYTLPLLIVLGSREEGAEATPFLAEVGANWPDDVRTIHVGALAPEDARRLAQSLLKAAGVEDDRLAEAIVHEAGGSPLLVEELARSHGDHGGESGTRLVAVTLDQVVSGRLDDLPPEARRLAEAVAVAGRPIPLTTLAAAAEVDEGSMDTFALLRAEGLIRMGFRNEREVAEPVHDRIRETIVGLVPPERLVQHHARLAMALEANPGEDFEALALHSLGAGDVERAVGYAERAADHAAAKLAFDQEVRLRRMALDKANSVADRQRLRVHLAEALVHAGNPAAASSEYASAAQSATATERVELERAAAEQLLSCGRIDEGKLALYRLLDVFGMRAPRSPVGAVLLLLFYRAWLALGGLRFRERSASDVSPEDRVRVDALAAVATGLGTVDVIVATCMHAKHLLIAKRRGDRMQVLVALAGEIAQLASTGPLERRRPRRVIERAMDLAARIGPEATAYVRGALGVALYMRGRYRESLETLDGALAAVPGGRGTSIARLFTIFSCFFLGRLHEARRRAARLLREVQERGDVYTSVSLQTTIMVDIALAADDPESASRHVREAMANWKHSGFHVQHWYLMWSEANIDLYRGEGARARARLERDARALGRSMLLHAQLIRGLTTYLRGCCAIASIDAEPGERRARVGEARRMARRLRRENIAYAPTLAAIVDAAAANADGDRPSAIASLREALGHAEEADMARHAWAIRHQLGLAIGGDEGRETASLAHRTMRDEGIRSPPRVAAVLVPGKWS